MIRTPLDSLYVLVAPAKFYEKISAKKFEIRTDYLMKGYF